MHEDAYIGLGSNLGDRRATLDSALRTISDLTEVVVVECSPYIETDPMGPVTQGRFLNAAAHIRTDLTARQLLDELQSIERAHGRVRDARERWGPRTLDLDLLLFGELVIDEPGLTVPHPRMHERLFVLEPLAAIAPDVVHPVLSRSVLALLQAARDGLTCARTRTEHT